MRIVLLLSGGIDSALLLAEYSANNVVHCVTFDYEQRHRIEIDAAEKLAVHYDVEHTIIKMGSLKRNIWKNNDAYLLGGDTKELVIPFRNAIMISMAVAMADSMDFGVVMIGCNGDDQEIFPDCTENFLIAMNQAAHLASKVDVRAPLYLLGKKSVIRKAINAGVPMKLTYSCYAGNVKPCGECLPCIDRKEAGI